VLIFVRKLGVLLLILSCVVLSGCIYNSISRSPNISEPVFAPIYQGYERDMSGKEFDKVVVSGNINANIECQQPYNQLKIMGTPNMRRSFANYIQNRTLYLVYGNYPGNFASREPLRVDLKLSSPIHQLTVTGDGETHLSGNLIFSRIDVTGSALLYAYWINSTNIHLYAGNYAKVVLAGVATNLDIIARDNANVDARFLRTQNAFVRTDNQANVAVRVKNSLSTLSTHSSTVYYYGDSNLNLHYLGNFGSALRMQGIAK